MIDRTKPANRCVEFYPFSLSEGFGDGEDVRDCLLSVVVLDDGQVTRLELKHINAPVDSIRRPVGEVEATFDDLADRRGRVAVGVQRRRHVDPEQVLAVYQ